MNEQKSDTPMAMTPERVHTFIAGLDKLAYEKPAGFMAYIATCMSSTKISDFMVADKDSAQKD